MQAITITKPDDMHVHLRDGALLNAVLPYTARQFGRAIIMPNLKPPVVTVAQALAYRDRILEGLPTGSGFEPLMTLYLTANTEVNEIKLAAEHRHIHAFKLYPAGATVNSDEGVADIKASYLQFAAMEKFGIPLLVHAEVADPAADIFDRERLFIERHLYPMTQAFPGLKVVLEHATTGEAVDFVKSAPPNVAATITPQHLTYNRNDLLAGGIRPHNYCLPVLKREKDRQALVWAATSGNPKFFLGTDSAPHPTLMKEAACGCAGCFSAPVALELYAEAFEGAGALPRLEGFASIFGAEYYGLPPNTGKVTLEKSSWEVPQSCHSGPEALTPLRAGETLTWKTTDAA